MVSSSVIAIEWSALTAGSLSLFASGHPSGSGEVEEGESDSKVPQKAKDALDKIDKDPETYLEDYYGGIEFKNKPIQKLVKQKYPIKILQVILNTILIRTNMGNLEAQNVW